jgi:hypothetical protein
MHWKKCVRENGLYNSRKFQIWNFHWGISPRYKIPNFQFWTWTSKKPFEMKKSGALVRRVNTFIILHTMEGTFKIRNLYEMTRMIYKFQNSESEILFLDPKLLNKSAVRFVLWWKSLNKIFIFPFWAGICMGATLRTQNLGTLCMHFFLYTNLPKKSANKIVLWWNLLNKTE